MACILSTVSESFINVSRERFVVVRLSVVHVIIRDMRVAAVLSRHPPLHEPIPAPAPLHPTTTYSLPATGVIHIHGICWIFTKRQFYLLEEVDDSEILGCTISTIQRTITVRQPKDLVSLRSGLSEDPDVARISAFRARALLIIRYAFPASLISLPFSNRNL